MNEAQAIDRLLQHDMEGLTWLVETHQLKALRTAYLVTQDRSLAEEVVQTKFVELSRTIRSFDRERPFEPWFLRGVVNLAINTIRRESRSRAFSEYVDAGEWLEGILEQTASVEEKVQQAELEKELRRGLANLAPEQRAALVLHYYLGLTDKEIAAAQREPLGTVKWRLKAGRERLRRQMEPDEEEQK
jgi:RNA polymerase sigma factor (sigma-70 family)